MKVYEVKLEKVTGDWGRFAGWERIALTLNKEKAEEIATAKREEAANIECWWMGYGKGNDGKPNVVVEELGEVVE